MTLVLNATLRARRPRARDAWSTRTYLVVIVLAAALATVAGAAYGFFWSIGQAEDKAVERLNRQAVRAAESITSVVARARQTVEALAAQPGIAAVFTDPTGCTLTVDGLGAFPSVRLDVVRADGVVSCSSGDLPALSTGAVHAGSPWLADGLSGTTVTWNAVDPVADEPALAVSTPIAGTKNVDAPAGVAVIFLHLRPSAAAMAREFGVSREVRFALVDGAAQDILSAQAADGAEAAEPLPTGQAGSTTHEGTRAIVGSADVADSDWRVVASLPQSTVFREAQGALVREALVGMVALIFLVGAAWLLNRRVAGPLRELTRAAEQASRDPDGPRVNEIGTTETVALARSLNSMLDVRAGHEAQLTHQATHDLLTGLPNKALLRVRLDQTLATSTPVAILCLGLDRFGLVNDVVGHDVGDRLLSDVADRLSAVLRPHDTLARFSGDEFVVLCPDMSADDAVRLAGRVQDSMAAPFRGPFTDISLTASIGIALGVGPTTTAGQLMRESDTAMRQAKTTGQPYHVFEQALQTRAAAYLVIQRDLGKALEAGELVVHYQPLVDIATGSIVAAEALVRWHHPERGIVPPVDFIPVAEDTGQITAIGEFVLTQACEQAARWASAGHRLAVSVNVSAVQLRAGAFPATVERVLAKTGLDADQLCLEVTESSVMTTAEQQSADLARLRSVGVHLAIDDFGTGYSSLAYLHDLPCDELKIDRSFISRLEGDSRESHLVGAIIGMAHALGLTVVAEGVETAGQLEILTRLGCQQVQGYLFSPAVPAVEFTALLRQTNEWNRLPAG